MVLGVMKINLLRPWIIFAIALVAAPVLAQESGSEEASPVGENESSTKAVEPEAATAAQRTIAPPPLPYAVSLPQVSSDRSNAVPPWSVPTQVPVTDLIGTAKKLKWVQTPVLFMPSRIRQDERRVLENAALVEAPLVWGMSGRLGADVTIDGAGEVISLKKGDLLPEVVILSDGKRDGRYTLYCTRNRIVQKEKGLNIIGAITNNIIDSLRDSQRCLQDTNSDGRLDLAVILGEGNVLIKAADISPIPFDMLIAEPIQGDGDKLAISMFRVGKKDVGLWLDVWMNGEKLMFTSLLSGTYDEKRNTQIRYTGFTSGTGAVMGVKFQVLEADPKTNEATLRWAPITNDPYHFIVIPRDAYTG